VSIPSLTSRRGIAPFGALKEGFATTEVLGIEPAPEIPDRIETMTSGIHQRRISTIVILGLALCCASVVPLFSGTSRIPGDRIVAPNARPGNVGPRQAHHRTRPGDCCRKRGTKVKLHRCPFCQRDTTLSDDRISGKHHALEIPNRTYIGGLYSTFTVCPNEQCQRAALSIALFGTNQKVTREWQLLPDSKAISFPAYAPEQIRADYEEAALNVAQSPKGIRDSIAALPSGGWFGTSGA